MSLNFREIDLVLKELDLTGSRIDKINQPDRYSLFLGTYSGKQKKQQIIISLAHGSVRLNRIGRKPDFPDYPHRFSQLLRSRIKGGHILSVSQPQGERIIHFYILCREEKLNLWIRLWGGNPNIILSDESNKIIDVYFRKPKQNEIQGKIYDPDFSVFREKKVGERPIREYDTSSDFNHFIEHEYGENRLIHDFTVIKENTLKKLMQKMQKSHSHIKKLETRKIRFSQWEELKNRGELLRTNLYQIKKGDKSVDVEDFTENKTTITIELQPELTPVQNCDRYFEKYKKYRQGYSLIVQEIEIQRSLNSELQEKYKTVLACNTLEELPEFSVEKKNKKSAKKQSGSGLQFSSSDFIIRVGRNAKENDELLRKSVKGNDIWLHVRDFPGGYVFIKSIKGKSIPLETLLDGANLALLYSSKKYKDKADIHYSKVKNIRRVKGGKQGQVLVQNEKNLFIKYDIYRITRLQNKSLLETISLNTDN